ncbi:MAG TPA: hypothetical protein PK379_13845 [Candidatus Hydrogenedentes bacterium]|nr:hypothetical protein [Candidatus Hydrogenedentota bacterium]
MNEPLAVTVFGSTGAIGRATLEVIRQYPERFQVRCLAAYRDIDTLSGQIAEFHPEAVAVIDANAAKRLRDRGPACVVLDGMAGCNELATRPVHRVVCGMVGASGLVPLLAAAEPSPAVPAVRPVGPGGADAGSGTVPPAGGALVIIYNTHTGET